MYNFGQLVLKPSYSDVFWVMLLLVLSLYIGPQTTIYEDDGNYYESSYTTPVLKFDKLPIIWWSKVSFESYKVPTLVQCGEYRCDVVPYTKQQSVKDVPAAYVFHPHKMSPLDYPLVPRNPAIVIWGAMLEESPIYCIECMHGNVIRQFNYSSTFSRYSDVPFPLRYIVSLNNITNKMHYVQTSSKNTLLNDISPILYLQTHCRTTTERDNYVLELMKLQAIDSYGKCINNKKLSFELTDDYIFHLDSVEQLSFIARYKFIIAIENAVCEDYITEKLWRALHLGVVPIYLGSPSVRDWLPNKKSAILLQDYPTPELLSEHINELLASDELYEEYLEHKIKGVITNKQLIEATKARPYQTSLSNIMDEFSCFLCNKLHESNKRPLPHRVINRSHFNCPLPISALTLNFNPRTNYSKHILSVFEGSALRYNVNSSDLVTWSHL